MSEGKIGIVGDGQLGRMLTEAAIPLDYDITVLGEAGPNSPAALVGARQMDGSITSAEDVRRLVESVDVTTWEIEHINAEALEELAEEGHDIQPAPSSLIIIQDKLTQKDYLTRHGIPVAPYEAVTNATDFYRIAELFDEDLIIKARKGGYDGRSNFVVTGDDTWQSVEAQFGDEPLYAERLVPFQRELSVVGARSRAGEIRLYPVVETIHKNNICHIVKAPAPIDPKVAKAAAELGQETIRLFNGAGVFAVEMFLDQDDNVLVNEVAPRVHNSGHWTDVGAETSQFEQHIRAIMGLPLGSTAMKYTAVVMVNILGKETGRLKPIGRPTIPQGRGQIRWYGKGPRPERKIGHISMPGDTLESALVHAQQILAGLSRVHGGLV